MLNQARLFSALLIVFQLVFLQIPVFVLAQPLTTKTSSSFVPYPAFIDSVDEGQYVTIYNKKSQNWKYCDRQFDPVTQAEKCKTAIGWPSRDAKITVVSPPVRAKVRDPWGDEDDEPVEETYVEVEFEYHRLGEDGKMHHQKGRGFIEMYHLKRSASNPYYGAQTIANSQKLICKPDPKNPNSPTAEAVKPFIDRIIPSAQNFNIADKAKLLNELVGKCPFQPAQKMKYAVSNGTNVYDQLVLPGLKKDSKILKDSILRDEKGKPMTQEQLISIDSVARTLYGEMAGCFRYGLHYPMAVAKVILNRTKSEKGFNEFVPPIKANPHDPSKPRISKVATTPSHFSMWQHTKTKVDKKTKKKVVVPNSALHMGLCPPRNEKQPFYRGQAAPKMESDIWTNALRIATEAVLHPTKFNERTKELVELHYTSDLAKYKNDEELKKVIPNGAKFILSMDQKTPSIENRTIDNGKCLEIWRDPRHFK